MINWKEIHKEFISKGHLWNEDHQQAWEKIGFTPQVIKPWIQIGCSPNDYDLVSYARFKNYQPSTTNWNELEKEYENWERGSKSAQEYLDINYPKEQRENITKLDISQKKLTGPLDLTDFVNLRELNCRDNRNISQLETSNCTKLRRIDCWANWPIASLDLTENPQLEELWCGENFQLSVLKLQENSQLRSLCAPNCKLVNLELGNQPFLEGIICWHSQLTNLDFLSQLSHLKSLTINNNNFPSSTDLTAFGHSTCLESLEIAKNRFTGSLEPLKNLTRLNTLDISDTEISQGLEYLPESLKLFCCKNTPLIKILKTYGEINQSNYFSSLQKWKISKGLTTNNNKTLVVLPIKKQNEFINYDWKQRATNLEKELNQLSNLVFPNQLYNFNQLKKEITRLKIKELTPQIREERMRLEKLITNHKNKVGTNFGKIIDLLLEIQKQIIEKKGDSEVVRAQLEGQLKAYRSILEGDLTKEELKELLINQVELYQLEKQLTQFKANELQGTSTLTSINSDFTNELVQQWQSSNFTYDQVKEWLNTGLQPTESSFAAWLRDTKHLTPEEVLNHGNYEQLKQEFLVFWEQLQVQQEQPPK